MNTDDLTAAVARLREAASCCGHVLVMAADLRRGLSALETAQADARRGKALADALRDNYYCECCDRAPAKSVQIALAAIVRAADALFASGYQYGQVAEAYDRARAAWKEES